MPRTLLLTGATDGIGLEAAKRLATGGHHLLVHGRSEDKLEALRSVLEARATGASIETYRADLSRFDDVDALASAIAERHDRLDVLINNAGIFKTATPGTESGLDVRFMVNTVAPYLLTRKLLPLMPASGRVINLSSAAQASVDLSALRGETQLGDSAAYAQSKLAITMWSAELARQLGAGGPAIIAVNPASLLGSKMVKEAYGVAGGDLGVGADILVRAALTDEFAGASGRYYDNDRQQFSSPHADALDAAKNDRLVTAIESLIASHTG